MMLLHKPQNKCKSAGCGTMEYPLKTAVASFCEVAGKEKSLFRQFLAPLPNEGISAKET